MRKKIKIESRIIGTEKDLKKLVHKMKDIFKEFGSITVEEYCELTETPYPCREDEKNAYGWFDISRFVVRIKSKNGEKTIEIVPPYAIII